MEKNPEIKIYCGGLCLGTLGGWGSILIYGERRKELSGREETFSAQRMVLTACVKSLEQIKIKNVPIVLYVAPDYLIKAFKEKWYENWRVNGWQTADKKPIKNRDLWEKLVELVSRLPCRFRRPDKEKSAIMAAVNTLARKAISEPSPKQESLKSIPLFRLEISFNLIPSENISLEKLSSLFSRIDLNGLKLPLNINLSSSTQKESKTENKEEAIEQFSEILKSNSESWTAIYGRGFERMKKGDLEEAKADFRQYLNLTKNSKHEQIQKDREAIFHWFPELKN